MTRVARPVLVATTLFLSVRATGTAAQEHAHVAAAPLRFGATAVGLWTLASPAFAGEDRAEVYLTQPMLIVHAMTAGGRLAAMATINLEGFTLRNGELAAGNAGEGYIDRRHPHTFVHEAMVVARPAAAGGFALSLAAGRGFAPFGTDDPMMRPFAKYPANHHLAQILERIVLIGTVRRGPMIAEVGLFNGDEPGRPEDFGRASRFGDSWSARATFLPTDWLELQASHASIESPEHALGFGLDQRKWSAAARFEPAPLGATRLCGLVEWARTDEYSVGHRVFTFESALAEVAARRGPWEAALRLERTTRPEEERLADPFRSARPHADENIVGITRWTGVTARLDRTFGSRALIEPFVEVSHFRIRTIEGILFDPVEQFGNDRLWNVSIGARISGGAQHERMGRYGVAVPVRAAAPRVES